MIAIDLGSNSLRCIEFDEKKREFLNECEFIVKTADNLHETGMINEEAVTRICDALLEAKKILDFTTHSLKAVTTEAMRKASNQKEVIDKIYERTAILFEVITPKEEASFAVDAVKFRLRSLGKSSSEFVLIDVGGGSTEIIFDIEGKRVSKSFPIGIVTLAQQCKSVKEIEELLELLFKDVVEFVSEIYQNYSKPRSFVATAGTPTTMAAYLNGMNYSNYDVQKINGYRLSLSDTRKVLKELQQMSDERRKFFVGVGRESLIVAGILIVQKLYEVLGYESAIVIDDGVREGVALSYKT